MEKRLVLFIVISVLILIGSSYLFPAKKTLPVKQETAVSTRAAAGVEKNELLNTPIGAIENKPAPEEKILTVDTPLYHAQLTNRGGAFKRWDLKKYTESDRTTSVKLLNEGISLFPLSLEMKEEGDLFLKGIYHVEGEDLNLASGKKEGTIIFYLKDAATGKGVQKKLTFHDDTYAVDVEIKTENIPSYEFLLGSNFGIHQWGDKSFVGFIGPTSLINNRVIKETPSKLSQEVVYEGKTTWTALQDKYFLAALIPKDEEVKSIVKKVKEGEFTVGVKVLPKQPASNTEQFVLFAGPKKLSILESLNVYLEETIDFGWFIAGSWSVVRIIAKPLFSILNFFYSFTHNYGIAIIFLTVSIKVLFIPLTHKSYKSMKGMQEVQPILADLQKKYKNDKPRLNKEIMEIYKTRKINPLGGCLPMVLQIPVFVALFNIFYTTIELRHAPFFLWVNDLSDYDHKYVLPVLMGITMFIQQKIQPTNMDPKQAKIMLFLPLIFTFFFLNFSSGLVLYWMVNNILSITQQVVTAKYSANGKQKAGVAEKTGKAVKSS
ncbi:MAG: membrane protein insertase YidC [Nitrospirae bacterium]|nr:membrane protein insertase YidC [Nitrospirota bacterium]MBI3351970.1 membrane protein insertase YidC [Nitrospirota bacterium]